MLLRLFANFDNNWRNKNLYWFFVTMILVVVYVCVNVRWVWLYRHAQPLDIDEAGYFIIAILDYQSLLAGGLTGWVHTVLSPSIQAPLMTALTSLIFAITGPHIVVGFALPIVSGVAIIVSSYFLARYFLPPAAAFAATALVASCPVILNYARSFHFALPATALTTLALLCLVRSERFSKLRWALLFGISIGLMPLARTMTIAFLPGLVLGATVYSIMGQGHQIRRLLILGSAFLLAIATAASWLGFNGVYVFDYLFNFGYGTKAVEYGAKVSLFGWNAWTDTVWQFLAYTYLPHALVVVAGLGAMILLMAHRIKQRQIRSFFKGTLAAPSFPIVICIVEALVALTSSQNKGTAFIAPIVPAILILSIYLVHIAYGVRSYHRLFKMSVILSLVVVTLPMLDLTWRPAKPWMIALPWLKEVMVSDGRGPLQQYEDFGKVEPQTEPGQPRDRAALQPWLTLNQTTARVLQSFVHDPSAVALGFRGFLYNINTIRLQIVLTGADIIHLIPIDPFETNGIDSKYQTWLTTGSAASACFLITLRDDKEDIQPPVLKHHMEEAAYQTGFLPVQAWPSPDGNVVTLWRRTMPRSSCFIG